VDVVTAEFDVGWVSRQLPDADPTTGGEQGDVWPAPLEPLAVARHLVEADGLLDDDGVLTARRWRGSFYLWTGTHWVEVTDPAVRARIYHVLEHAKYWKQGKNGTPELMAWAPTRRKVGDVLEALQAVVHLSERLDPPTWVDVAGDQHLVAVQNGLLHLSTRRLEAHSPRLFNLTSLPYDYNQAAPVPRRWLRFLRDLWPGDRESRRLLQEWFGYVLSGETNLHKILLLVGPPRSGKGTIARVLTALVGRENTAGPTLASLGQNFGLSPLLGKPLAVVSDARLGGDTFTVVERLLSISGEDAITVDRKYRDAWTGRLPTRFVVISNELPDLGDASGAIATRFLVLTLAKSWLGQENPALTEDLLQELPGILLWALQGLDRLNQRAHFTEPATSRDAVVALADLASPVAAFVREACERGPEREVPARQLYEAWRVWSKDHGRDRPTTEQRFGRDLRAAVPGLKVVRPADNSGPRPRHYAGIALCTAYQAYVGAAHIGDVHGPSRTEKHDPGDVHVGPRTDPLWPAPATATLNGYVRCSACGTPAQLDMASDYGRRRRAEGHLECRAPWSSAL
jgi:putative DNA primase/helicase